MRDGWCGVPVNCSCSKHWYSEHVSRVSEVVCQLPRHAFYLVQVSEVTILSALAEWMCLSPSKIQSRKEALLLFCAWRCNGSIQHLRLIHNHLHVIKGYRQHWSAPQNS